MKGLVSFNQHCIVEHLLYFFKMETINIIHFFHCTLLDDCTVCAVCRKSILTFDRHFIPSFPLLTGFRGSKERWLRQGQRWEVLAGGCFGSLALYILGRATKRGHCTVCPVFAWEQSVCIQNFFHSHSRFLSTPTTQCLSSPDSER